MCGDLEISGNADWTSQVMIGRSYSLVSAESFAAGPTGCVDWKRFMRGAAALAYLSLQHKNFGFDWTREKIRKLTQGNFALQQEQKLYCRPKIPGAFNDLRLVLHDKA